jgi:hypothetical protein
MQHMVGNNNNKQDDQKTDGLANVEPEIAQDERYKNLDPRVRKFYG